MLSSIPKTLRAFGNSAAQIFQNLLGYFPAPFLYGFVCRFTGGSTSRWGMIMLMFWSLFGIIGLYNAKISQEKQSFMRMERFRKNEYIELETTASENEDSKKCDEHISSHNKKIQRSNKIRELIEYVPHINQDKKGFKELKYAVIDYNQLPGSSLNLLNPENLENMAVLMGRGGPSMTKRTMKEEMLI